MIPFQISPPGPVPDFRFLSSASVLASHYSASVSSFPFSSCLRLTVASSVLRFCSRFFGFPRSLQPGFPCLPSRFRYSAFCWFPFVLSCFAPAAVPQVIPFQISPPGPTPDFRFLSSASMVAPHYSAFCFFLSVLPVSASQWLPRCSLSAFASWASPFSPA